MKSKETIYTINSTVGSAIIHAEITMNPQFEGVSGRMTPHGGFSIVFVPPIAPEPDIESLVIVTEYGEVGEQREWLDKTHKLLSEYQDKFKANNIK